MIGHATPRGERGETLVETLVTVAVVGTTVVAVMFGLATVLDLSRAHGDRSDAAVVLAAAADSVIDAEYVACPGVSTESYDPVDGVGLPAQWTAGDVAVTSVLGWDGASFAACTSSDLGLQLVTVEVKSPDGEATRSVDVVKRASP